MFHLEDAFCQSPSDGSIQILADSISPRIVPIQVAWHDFLQIASSFHRDDQNSRLKYSTRLLVLAQKFA